MATRVVLTFAFGVWALLLSPVVASAEATIPRFDEIRFTSPKSIVLSADRTRFEFGPAVALSGSLSLPTGKGPFPLIVIAHGCNGIGLTETGWANVLREWGYAVFLLDSFTDRHLDESCTSAATLRPIQRLPDVYAALHVLAKHPKIDSRRAVLMGFSHGGAVALTASTVWAKAAFAPAGQPAFRAFLSFYPANCNVEYPERKNLSAPVRVHIGELDDWTPAAPCLRLANEWKKNGQDGSVTAYAGAHHSFDQPDLTQTHLPNVDNGAACTIRVGGPLGPLVPPVEGIQCVRKGATIAGNRDASTKAEQSVRHQLSELLR